MLRPTFPSNFALIAVLLCLAASSARAEKWNTLKYPEDGFRALFPSTPKLDQSEKNAETGSIKLSSYCSQVDQTSLCVAVIDQGAQATNMDTDTLFERARLSVYAVPNTHKISETQQSLDGNKGVEIVTENETTHSINRIYEVGETLYQTVVAYPRNTKYADSDKFLDSFHLIPRIRH